MIFQFGFLILGAVFECQFFCGSFRGVEFHNIQIEGSGGPRILNLCIQNGERKIFLFIHLKT